MRAWIHLVAVLVGVLALSALVWFAGPLIAIADVRPLDATWVRALIVAVFFAIAGLLIFLDWRRRKKASQAIEDAMSTSEEAESDTPVLRDALKDAIATLRKSKTK